MVNWIIFGYIKGHLGSVKTIKKIKPCFNKPLPTRARQGSDSIKPWP